MPRLRVSLFSSRHGKRVNHVQSLDNCGGLLDLETLEVFPDGREWQEWEDDADVDFSLSVGDVVDVPVSIDFVYGEDNEFMVVYAEAIAQLKRYAKDNPDLVEPDPDDYDEESDLEDTDIDE